MRTSETPTPDQLRLGSTIPRKTAYESLRGAVGDPAYLHEMEGALQPFTRKMLEKAANKLIDEGKIVQLGRGTRRLYASSRPVDEDLSEMKTAHIRFLQYMPIAGAAAQGDIRAKLFGASQIVKALVEQGVLIQLQGQKKLVMLTQLGARLRTSLGDGLAVAPVTCNTIRQMRPAWWESLDTIARHGFAAHEGDKRNQRDLENHGFAEIRKGTAYITQVGRAAWHEYDDLMQVSRLIKMGIPLDRVNQKMMKLTANKRATKIARHAANTLPIPGDGKIYAYLLMRTDMSSLGLGKSRAQAMHAGNQLTYALYAKPLEDGKKVDPLVKDWHQQGAGFGTAIAIGARNQITLEVLEETIEAAQKLGFMAGLVVDEEYPYNASDEMLRRINPDLHTREPVPYKSGWRCFCRETTSGWIIGDKKKLEVLLARFDLTPHAEREWE